MKRRSRRFAVAVAVGSIALLGGFAGQARASGGSAAQDQYSPPPVVKPGGKPTGGKGSFTPPGAQASAPAPVSSQGSTLPFTGLSLLAVVLVGAGLLLLGILLRRGVPRRGP